MRQLEELSAKGAAQLLAALSPDIAAEARHSLLKDYDMGYHLS